MYACTFWIASTVKNLKVEGMNKHNRTESQSCSLYMSGFVLSRIPSYRLRLVGKQRATRTVDETTTPLRGVDEAHLNLSYRDA